LRSRFIHDFSGDRDRVEEHQCITAVGADAYNYGAKTGGFILINRMKGAGS
jgi:PmbA protein